MTWLLAKSSASALKVAVVVGVFGVVTTSATAQAQDETPRLRQHSQPPCLSSDVFVDLCFGAMKAKTNANDQQEQEEEEEDADTHSPLITTDEYVSFLNQMVAITSKHNEINSKETKEQGISITTNPPRRFDQLSIDLQLPFVKFFCEYMAVTNAPKRGGGSRIKHLLTGNCYIDMQRAGQTDTNFGFPLEDAASEAFVRSACDSIYHPAEKRGWIAHCPSSSESEESGTRSTDNNTSEVVDHSSSSAAESGATGVTQGLSIGIAMVIGLMVLSLAVAGGVFLHRRRKRRKTTLNETAQASGMHDRGSETDDGPFADDVQVQHQQQQPQQRDRVRQHPQQGGTMFF
jgi:hypothetical protein